MPRIRLPILPFIALFAIAAGAVAPMLLDDPAWRSRIWFAALILAGAPVVYRTLRGVLRGQFAADVVAMLAITGAVLIGEPLAGLVIVLMQTGGEALEAYAVRRASMAVEQLEADAPRRAQRLAHGTVEEITADEVAIGDQLLIRPGDLIPCDVVVLSGTSLVDTSRLTGESVPVSAAAGTALPSGSVNSDGVLTVQAVHLARESQYARIVELVRTAQASKSPFQRIADRWAVWFTPIALLACLAAWITSHDWHRVLAVLVVATPCPLLLAVPVAIIAGINRAARRSIVIRHGGALEALAQVDYAIFDKTGTLTIGRPHISMVQSAPPGAEARVLTLAAGVERTSSHLLARVVTEEAEARHLPVLLATVTTEVPGRGVSGTIDGEFITVGSATLAREQIPAARELIDQLASQSTGLSSYFAAQLGTEVLAGRIDFADQLRPDLAEFFSALGALGIRHTLLLSGDHTQNVKEVAMAVGVADFAGDLRSEDKAVRVQALERAGSRVLMVGDGTNDAPALSAATVGVALAGHGGGITAEAADVVLLVDDLHRVVEAIQIGKRTMQIARQSVAVGLGLSALGMVIAGLGYLPPTLGALAQEGIDIAVILNALRAVGGGRRDPLAR